MADHVTKYADLVNFVTDDVLHLGQSIAKAIRNTRGSRSMFYSFFDYAGLTL